MSIPAQGALGAETAAETVTILYENYRGETAVRRITPIAREWFGSSDWHPEPQWLFTAFDMGKGVFRDFARAGVKAWGQAAVDAALASPRADSDERTAGEPQGAWMQTFCLPHFRVLDPDPSQILIEDIAHHLSQNVRYGGAGIRFLSVAEHSVHMARAASPEHALWALLHDASETYLHDLVRPVKRSLAGYAQAEDRIMRAVCERFGMPLEMPREVKRLDNRILIDETRQNMRPSDVTWSFGGETEPLGVTLQYWTPERAEREFLATFAAITGLPVTMPATPAQPAGVVPDSLREAFEAAELHECWVNGDTADVMTNPYGHCGNFDQIVARCATGDLWRKRAVAIAESLNFVRTLLASHPAGQSAEGHAGSTEPHTDWNVGDGVYGASDKIAPPRPFPVPNWVSLTGAALPAGQSAGSGAAWIVTNGETGDDLRFRMWSGRAWVWTSSLSQAARFAREGDAKQILPDGDEHGERVEPAADSTRTGQGEAEDPADAAASVREVLRKAVSKPLHDNQFLDDWNELVDPVVDAVLAARPAAPEAQGAWSFDMEAAPRDGTLILVTRQHETGTRYVETSAWRKDSYGRWFWGRHGNFDRSWSPAVAWKPLDAPAPPASSGQGGR